MAALIDVKSQPVEQTVMVSAATFWDPRSPQLIARAAMMM
jgi:hypothetical protein